MTDTGTDDAALAGRIRDAAVALARAMNAAQAAGLTVSVRVVNISPHGQGAEFVPDVEVYRRTDL